MIRSLLVALALVLCAGPVLAQTADQPDAAAGRTVEFLPRVVLRLSAEHLSGEDPRFVWDANFGGELDILDYGAGRATFVANYQAVLGEELKAFDPNQGNYLLSGSASRRVAGWELAAVFHHESRHLSDREKRISVDWNMLGGRVQKEMVRGGLRTEARADVRGVVQKSFVDYQWEVDAGVRNRMMVRRRLFAIAAFGVRVLGVDGSRGRGTQGGARGEGGVRVEGGAGAVELFLAAERRIDPYQLEFSTASWFIAGFRLLSR